MKILAPIVVLAGLVGGAAFGYSNSSDEYPNRTLPYACCGLVAGFVIAGFMKDVSAG